ncbi:hypothetical protein B0F90DRAFT_1756905 [Multifurca ochricompacta]|uniref:Uncharacterized protein n=1 Tax=Multifurca ochricompacta TaxID=376703 RepID=A0AAD4M028_9AGAM|nr:hypothetical protein B0F90DRAFT_1756905 [Multifurca ochricompacta]
MSASDQSPSPTVTDTSSPPPMRPAKRKISQEPDLDGPHPHNDVPPSKDFEAGRVTCEACGESVSYRDERTGVFTTKHWDAHRLGCSTSSSAFPAPEPVRSRSHSHPRPPSLPTEPISAGPPSKRRRAKRSEEERIEYLRSDPYVAQFEPYRVLCASCDKWIRLRPNSTYCSIPWDAHRKSCLARKGAKDPAPSFAATDPDARNRKHDGERVLCKLCNSSILVGPDDQAAQAWSQHQCRPTSPSALPSASTIPSVPPPSQRQLALKEKEKERLTSPLGSSSSPQPPPALQPSDAPSSAAAAASAAVSESRRRNAEQRAAHLRADPLLAQVEPHRVFCALCRKWVQLRQDSTFCAYPWHQHRSKCVIRHEKKTKTAPTESVTHSGRATPTSADELTDNGELGPEFEELLDSTEDVGAVPDSHVADNQAPFSPPRYADLDSPADRLSFTRHSIDYLFHTTYTPADALTIAALVAYMNAALPPDKHEEFDTAEVTRAAKTLHDRGRVAFEGDTLKLLYY